MDKQVLVVDDSYFFRNQISLMLQEAGYRTALAEDGEGALAAIDTQKPDLVLLDVEMPGMTGFEVCRLIRQEQSYNLTPIIMLTSKDDLDDKLVGLELGADDYITKPFDKRELLSRIRNTLVRIQRNREASPLTGLAGNIEITREINHRLATGALFAVIYVDLDNFKAYNDVYGFLRGDTMIKLVADILGKQLKLFGGPGDFSGHIGGDDFILLTTPDRAPQLSEAIIDEFDDQVRQLFQPEDLQAGYVTKVNRKGETERYPITTITLAAITCYPGRFERDLQVSATAAELKGYLKLKTGSNYMMDRRKSELPGKM